MSKITLYEKQPLKNETRFPQKYTRKFLEQGLVDYKDSGYGTLLLPKKTIDEIIPSFIGKPVIIKHQEVTPGNFLDSAVGYITNISFNPADGWYYVDFLITHDEGHDKLADGWGVSCFYKAQMVRGGGKYHNVDYDGEIVSGEGEHLALVKNPRYEECLEAMPAMMVNDKEAYLYNEKTYLAHHKQSMEDTEMFKIIGKKDEKKGFSVDSLIQLANGVKMKIKDMIALYNAQGDVHEVDENAIIDLGNGKTISLKDLVNAVPDKGGETNKVKEDEGEKDEEKKSEDDAEGKNKKDIKNAKAMKNCSCGAKDGDDHKEGCAGLKNAEDPTDKDKDDVKAANAKIAELENEIKALKEGAANFDSFVRVANAKKNVASEEAIILKNGTLECGSMEAGLARGKEYFGSVNK